MLIKRLKAGETVHVGEVVLTVLEIRRDCVRFGLTAPPEMNIARRELIVPIQEYGR